MRIVHPLHVIKSCKKTICTYTCSEYIITWLLYMVFWIEAAVTFVWNQLWKGIDLVFFKPANLVVDGVANVITTTRNGIVKVIDTWFDKWVWAFSTVVWDIRAKAKEVPWYLIDKWEALLKEGYSLTWKALSNSRRAASNTAIWARNAWWYIKDRLKEWWVLIYDKGWNLLSGTWSLLKSWASKLSEAWWAIADRTRGISSTDRFTLNPRRNFENVWMDVAYQANKTYDFMEKNTRSLRNAIRPSPKTNTINQNTTSNLRDVVRANNRDTWKVVNMWDRKRQIWMAA